MLCGTLCTLSYFSFFFVVVPDVQTYLIQVLDLPILPLFSFSLLYKHQDETLGEVIARFMRPSRRLDLYILFCRRQSANQSIVMVQILTSDRGCVKKQGKMLGRLAIDSFST